MFRRLLRVALALFIFVLAHPGTATSQAGSGAYLKFGTIKGESRDKNHKDWIEVLSYSFGVPARSNRRCAVDRTGHLNDHKGHRQGQPVAEAALRQQTKHAGSCGALAGTQRSGPGGICPARCGDQLLQQPGSRAGIR